jgi:hypothetical protein
MTEIIHVQHLLNVLVAHLLDLGDPYPSAVVVRENVDMSEARLDLGYEL